MSGQKLDYAKRAVLKLVKHLSVNDTLHFLTYDSTARVVFRSGDLSEAGKEGLRATVNSVQARGQTNLCGGLEAAVQVLTNNEEKSTSDGTVRRIFLFSDGCVNVGVTDPLQIRRKVAVWAAQGITTSTFGIGTDFDESLMRGIAESGTGRYKFLATARDIPKIVSKSVHDLLDLYASEVALDIRGGEHTIVTRVYGSDDDDGSAAEAPGLIHLGDLHNANDRLVLAELEVSPPGHTGEGNAFAAAEWILTGQRDGSPIQISGEVTLLTTRSRQDLGDEATPVLTAFAIRRGADMDLEVAECLARGDRQRARETKTRQMALLQEALEAAQRDNGDTEMLSHVIERAQCVALQINDEREDVEVVRRQCVQERELNCAMSCASFGDRENSSCSGGDVANLRDLDGFGSPPPSPRCRVMQRSPNSSPFSSPGQSPNNSPPGSPRTSSRSPPASGTPPGSISTTTSGPVAPVGACTRRTDGASVMGFLKNLKPSSWLNRSCSTPHANPTPTPASPATLTIQPSTTTPAALVCGPAAAAQVVTGGSVRAL
jgi:hypothetical protein